APRSLLAPCCWSGVIAAAVEPGADILALEAQVLLLSNHHLLRSSARFGRRLLALVDNLPLCLAVSKGRDTSPLLKLPLLKIALLSLALDSRLRWRWASPRRRVASGPTDAVRQRVRLAAGLVASVAPSGALGHLERAAVRSATQSACGALLGGLPVKCSARLFALTVAAELDGASAAYLCCGFTNGKVPSKGSQLQAALVHCAPGLAGRMAIIVAFSFSAYLRPLEAMLLARARPVPRVAVAAARLCSCGLFVNPPGARFPGAANFGGESVHLDLVGPFAWPVFARLKVVAGPA
ncbi:unnamed protein product, partial [Prorocentrum cordatum]